jgi:hypothetical protein
MRDATGFIDDYIENAAPFARPILKKIRAAFHKADKRIIESVKWGNPTFEYKGILGGMSAFKEHVSWGMWKAQLLGGSGEVREKVKTLADLPSEKEMIAMIREAMRLNEEGIKVPKPERAPRPTTVDVPADLSESLSKNAKARATFEKFSPSHKREYVEWITEAKQEATRQKRLAQTIEWLVEGKSRNWKYERKS